MPGPVLHLGASLLCAHGGQAQPTQPNPRVLLSGQPALTLGPPLVVAGCPFATASPQPCVTASFTTASVRVQAMGVPLLLADSVGLTVPNGVPVIVAAVQPRVVAQ